MDSGFRATLRRSHAALAAMLLSLTITSCSGETAQAKQGSPKGISAPALALTNQGAVAQKPKSKVVGTARGRGGRTMTQSDALFLEMADRGCRNNDFYSFFQAFSGSWAVRERFVGDTLTVGPEGRSLNITRRRYLDKSVFPVSPMDNDYVTAASADNFARSNNGNWRDLLYVRLAFDFAQESRVSVEWMPGTFERHLDTPPPELEEGLGRMIRQTKEGGVLLFAPTGKCWELVADIVQAAGKHLDQ